MTGRDHVTTVQRYTLTVTPGSDPTSLLMVAVIYIFTAPSTFLRHMVLTHRAILTLSGTTRSTEHPKRPARPFYISVPPFHSGVQSSFMRNVKTASMRQHVRQTADPVITDNVRITRVLRPSLHTAAEPAVRSAVKISVY